MSAAPSGLSFDDLDEAPLPTMSTQTLSNGVNYRVKFTNSTWCPSTLTIAIITCFTITIYSLQMFQVKISTKKNGDGKTFPVVQSMHAYTCAHTRMCNKVLCFYYVLHRTVLRHALCLTRSACMHTWFCRRATRYRSITPAHWRMVKNSIRAETEVRDANFMNKLEFFFVHIHSCNY